MLHCGGVSDRWGVLGSGVRFIGAVHYVCLVSISVSVKACVDRKLKDRKLVSAGLEERGF